MNLKWKNRYFIIPRKLEHKLNDRPPSVTSRDFSLQNPKTKSWKVKSYSPCFSLLDLCLDHMQPSHTPAPQTAWLAETGAAEKSPNRRNHKIPHLHPRAAIWQLFLKTALSERAPHPLPLTACGCLPHCSTDLGVRPGRSSAPAHAPRSRRRIHSKARCWSEKSRATAIHCSHSGHSDSPPPHWRHAPEAG